MRLGARAWQAVWGGGGKVPGSVAGGDHASCSIHCRKSGGANRGVGSNDGGGRQRLACSGDDDDDDDEVCQSVMRMWSWLQFVSPL